MTDQRFDIAIVGAGSAGLIGADFAARIGARVALIERDRIGGDCTWTGCVPSKALLHAGRLASDARRSGSFGVDAGEPHADMRRVLKGVRQTIATVYAHTTPEALAEKGIDVVRGAPRFADAYTLVVGERKIVARRIVICTGARARIPDIPGLRDLPYLTYQGVFDIEELPRKLTVLGAGPLGVEMAQAFARLGSTVAIVGPELLPREERETQTLMREVLARDGVTVVLARGTGARSTPSGIEVSTSAGPVVGDRLLVAAGRAPRVDSLDLERAGVHYSERGIPVDRYLRTNVKHIFACGDVVGGAQFSHLAGWQCFHAVRTALLPGRSAAEPRAMPAVTFTEPEVARVGLLESEARTRFGDAARVHLAPITLADRAVCDGETQGFVKVITDRHGTILGATIVATRAGEMIAEVALAMQHDLTIDAIAQTIHAYPTWSSALQFVAVDMMMSRLRESRLFRAAVGLAGLDHRPIRSSAGHPGDGDHRG